MQNQQLRLLLVHPDPALCIRIVADLNTHNIEVVTCCDFNEALAHLFETPPDAIAVDYNLPPENGFAISNMVKRDSSLAHIPVLMGFRREQLKYLKDQEPLSIDDFIVDWNDTATIALRIRLSIETGGRELDANPLTRLPGNNSIQRSLRQRIERKEQFAIAYCDLDNFKSYNDKYGFARGDEVIRLTARLIVNIVQSHSSHIRTLVGHIGGDDFVFIVPVHIAEMICKEVIMRFEQVIRTAYDSEDLDANGINSTNRKGEKEFFPIMSISIAVAQNREGCIEHLGELSKTISELKKFVKNKNGSNYFIDRRI